MLQIVWWKVEATEQVPVELYKDYCEIALYHINKARKPSVESKEISEEMLVPFPFIEAKKFGNKMALYARLQVIVVTFFFLIHREWDFTCLPFRNAPRLSCFQEWMGKKFCDLLKVSEKTFKGIYTARRLLSWLQMEKCSFAQLGKIFDTWTKISRMGKVFSRWLDQIVL